jgi:apolipoprotein N-acyltransferase
VAAALWTAIEYVRSFLVVGGFPWASLGYAQHLNRPLCAMASVTGVYGLSFVVVLVGAALADVFLALRQRGPFPRRAGLALALAGVLHLVGWIQLSGDAQRSAQGPPVETVRMAVLQGNIDQGVKWNPEWADETLQIYEALSRRAATRGAKLIVWPETAVPSSILTDPEARARLSDLARETGAALVVGGVGIEVGGLDSAGNPDLDDLHYFDSAFVFDNQGVLRDRYDKAHLVPFGEYIPLQALAGGFLKAIAAGISLQGITPGDAPRAMDLTGLWEGKQEGKQEGERDGEEPTASRLTFGVPICYELVFPDLVRRMVRDGSRVLLGITNDAWYGRTGAPYQFLSMTAMRSAENRVWTVRAANTGVSALIDDRGRVLEQTKLFEEGLLVQDIPLAPPGPARSWYARHGDVFVFACAVFVLGLLVMFGVRPRTLGEALNE